MQSIIILGRQPKIGLAELESLYSTKNIKPFGPTAALLDIPADKIEFLRLGGALKLGTLLGCTKVQHLNKEIFKLIKHLDLPIEGKINIGLSAYGGNFSAKALQILALKIKKELKRQGHSIRIIPNREPALNTAQVLHNRLATNRGVELLLVVSGDDLIIARTTKVQDITDYTARDRMRPKRDAFVGMLPPKLAQIIINLASGVEANQPKRLLDPFCGTGVILQEALLAGLDVYGTDNSQKMIDYSTANIEWLKDRWQQADGSVAIELGDATSHNWTQPISLVASETYLGKPLTSLPKNDEFVAMVGDINHLHKKFLQNIHSQLLAGTRLCLAVPAWYTNNGYKSLPILDQLAVLGYNRVAFENSEPKELIYRRPDQIVARELVTLIRI